MLVVGFEEAQGFEQAGEPAGNPLGGGPRIHRVGRRRGGSLQHPEPAADLVEGRGRQRGGPGVGCSSRW